MVRTVEGPGGALIGANVGADVTAGRERTNVERRTVVRREHDEVHDEWVAPLSPRNGEIHDDHEHHEDEHLLVTMKAATGVVTVTAVRHGPPEDGVEGLHVPRRLLTLELADVRDNDHLDLATVVHAPKVAGLGLERPLCPTRAEARVVQRPSIVGPRVHGLTKRTRDRVPHGQGSWLEERWAIADCLLQLGRSKEDFSVFVNGLGEREGVVRRG